MKYTTLKDKSQLFAYQNLASSPVNFITPGAKGDADIVVDDGQVFQTIVGYGASISRSSRTTTIPHPRLITACTADSSAQLLNDLKVTPIPVSLGPQSYVGSLEFNRCIVPDASQGLIRSRVT